MSDLASARQALTEPVRLVEYDPRWPGQFEDEQRRLQQEMPGVFVEIRHIGSTAIPGMIAKPTIDLLAGVTDWNGWPKLRRVLAERDYAFDAIDNARYRDRKWLYKHLDGRRTHHLHIVLFDSPAWHQRVRFCELLLQRPDLQGAYAALKRDLAMRYRDNRAAYAAAKSVFIKSIVLPHSG